MYIILGSFCAIFRENYVRYVIIYILFPILCFGMVLFYVLQVFGPFCPCFDLNECILPTNVPELPHPWKERRIEECGVRADHGRSVVDATVVGVSISCEAFCFLANSSTS